MARDLERELIERGDNDWAPCWRPKPGETLIGTVRRYDVGQNQFGEVRTVTIEREDGTGPVSVWLSSEVLRREFERQRPKIGERVGIRFIGRHPERQYNRWAVITDREEGEPDFRPLGGERGDAEDLQPATQDPTDPFTAPRTPPHPFVRALRPTDQRGR